MDSFYRLPRVTEYLPRAKQVGPAKGMVSVADFCIYLLRGLLHVGLGHIYSDVLGSVKTLPNNEKHGLVELGKGDQVLGLLTLFYFLGGIITAPRSPTACKLKPPGHIFLVPCLTSLCSLHQEGADGRRQLWGGGRREKVSVRGLLPDGSH